MIPTTEQISEMTREQLEEAIRLLDQEYGLERTITEFTAEIDLAVNALCDIWYRQDRLTVAEKAEKSHETKAANKEINSH